MKKFEVGKQYKGNKLEYGFITIIRRTEKTVLVRGNVDCEWRMVIRHDEDGNEYIIDSAAGRKWRDAFTYQA